ncbi:hypothetical protein CDL12_03549 [Handroanthus impetiginosus]|uniref:Uncharacterized protein n=1 Tax=Handroanthus impetiginosus TaxID=429701 RepID=A0A2G9I1V5_9LAMI|nr:hypothetical protein CDL12_03549 [Handroanthus impetiginosus]
MTCQKFEDMECCENPMAMGRVVCPKTRRVRPSNFTNSTVPFRFHLRNDVVVFDSKPVAELLDPIFHKEGFEGEHCAIVSSSPPFFLGSPPCRAPNPLVHDAHFRIENLSTTVPSPYDSGKRPSAHSKVKFGNKQAVVRVEGFGSQSSRVVSMV